MKLSKILTFTVTVLMAQSVFASSASEDMDSLGASRDLVRKARKVNPDNKISIVQKRAVDRNLRLETSVGYGFISGGNPYLDSRQLGVDLDFHITPRWSIGARYASFDNDLSSEGQRVYSDSVASGVAPDVNDFAKDAAMATVTWYPVYGKINLFNWNVTQFDIYLTAGYGQIQLNRSGGTDIMTVGGGAGFWLTNWLSTRFEVRYQHYNDIVGAGQERGLDQTVFAAKLGFLL